MSLEFMAPLPDDLQNVLDELVANAEAGKASGR